jgi:hypothetical protein
MAMASPATGDSVSGEGAQEQLERHQMAKVTGRDSTPVREAVHLRSLRMSAARSGGQGLSTYR